MLIVPSANPAARLKSSGKLDGLPGEAGMDGRVAGLPAVSRTPQEHQQDPYTISVSTTRSSHAAAKQPACQNMAGASNRARALTLVVCNSRLDEVPSLEPTC